MPTINGEAQIVQKCFIPRNTRDSTETRVSKDEIQDCLSENNIDETLWGNIEYCFERIDDTYCQRCGLGADLCECEQNSNIVTDQQYKIDTERLAERWIRWVSENDVFSDISGELGGNSPFRLSATYSGDDLTLYIAFSVSEYHGLDIDPDRPTFVAAFFHDTEIFQKKNVIPWYHFVYSDYRRDFRKKIKELNKVYSANIAKYENISDFEGEVNQAIQNAMEEYGFETLLEPERIDIADEYRIDTGKSELGFKRDDWRGLLCRCEKSDEYHFHLFKGEDIISVSADENIDSSIKRLREKIRRYRRVERFKDQTRAKGTAANALAALFTGIVLSVNFGPVKSFLSNYVPIVENVGALSTLLLGIAILILVVYALAVFLPFVYGWISLDWDITVE